jgi:glycosyltransferase involved in cell wall biosynthesis
MGFDEDRFTPASQETKSSLRKKFSVDYNIPSQATWVGNLAALVPHKDHETLLAAALIVLMRHPETIFLIAGEGPEGTRLLKSVRRRGLLGKIFLLGNLPDPVTLLKSLDLFVLSSWGEGMGSVLLEASACGLAIVATRAGGIPEIIQDGESGLLCAPRDPEALAANILRLMEDGGLAERLSQGALERVQGFGLKAMAWRMEEIYERL